MRDLLPGQLVPCAGLDLAVPGCTSRTGELQNYKRQSINKKHNIINI